MDLETLTASLKQDAPPAGLSPPLEALWRLGRDDWEGAHKIVQELGDFDAAWVHAHLHRAEGDPGNAAYWYRRAGKPVSSVSVQDEWEEIVTELLGR